MITCNSCGNPIPDDARFCPVCGEPVDMDMTVAPAYLRKAPVENESEQAPTESPTYANEENRQTQEPQPESPAPGSEPKTSWYDSAPNQEQKAAPAYVPVKPSIGGIFDFYRKALAVLAEKPFKLWGLSLLYLLIASIITSLGSFVPLISIPVVLVLSLGFTGVLLRGYHGEEVHSVQLFEGFKKEEVVRNGAGMCWKELWTLIWGFVPVMNIIKAYAYCFVPYILLTDKEISATEALKKSMRMTDGYKGKLFGADVLCVVGFFLALIVLVLLGRIPYIGWIFAIAAFLLYVAFILFAPLFMGLVRTAFFEEISTVHKD